MSKSTRSVETTRRAVLDLGWNQLRYFLDWFEPWQGLEAWMDLLAKPSASTTLRASEAPISKAQMKEFNSGPICQHVWKQLFPGRPGDSWVHVTYGNLRLTRGWICRFVLFFSSPPSSKMFYNSYNTLGQLRRRFLGTCDLRKFAVNPCSVLCLFDVSYLVILKCKKNPGTWAWPRLESE